MKYLLLLLLPLSVLASPWQKQVLHFNEDEAEPGYSAANVFYLKFNDPTLLLAVENETGQFSAIGFLCTFDINKKYVKYYAIYLSHYTAFKFGVDVPMFLTIKNEKGQLLSVSGFAYSSFEFRTELTEEVSDFILKSKTIDFEGTVIDVEGFTQINAVSECLHIFDGE